MNAVLLAPTLRDRLRLAPARPLVLGPSLIDVFPSGEEDDPAHAIVHALRRGADAIVALQRTIVATGVDAIFAPTAHTTAPALHATGQAYRAAALTAAAVDLSRDAVLAGGGSACVLGEVTASAGSRARLEARTHVERLATSAIDGVWILASDAGAARDVVEAAQSHRIPAFLEVTPTLDVSSLAATPVAAIVVSIAADGDLAATIERARAAAPQTPLGVRLLAPDRDEQTAIAAAFATCSTLELSVLAVGGRTACSALRALVDLARAPRASTTA